MLKCYDRHRRLGLALVLPQRLHRLTAPADARCRKNTWWSFVFF
jgi:hypothetical protein